MDASPEPPEKASKKYDRADFKNPPIVLRKLSVPLNIPRGLFDEKVMSLLGRIQGQGGYSELRMKQQWDFQLEFKGSTPIPKGRLTHIPGLIRKIGSEVHTLLEITPPIDDTPAVFTIEQHRSDENPTQFEDLEADCKLTLPIVMGELNLLRVQGLEIEYRNVISQERYPRFWEDEKKFALGSVVTVFGDVPDPSSYILPISVDFNQTTDRGDGTRTRFAMKSKIRGKRFDLVVINGYSSLQRNKDLSIDEVWEELSAARELIFYNFIRHFGEPALDAFCQ